MTVVVVGGGVLGLMHALEARRLGHDVVHLEREAGSRLWPLSDCIALISSWLEPSGLASLILMPYLAVKSFMIVP